jgi:hypothetical protein
MAGIAGEEDLFDGVAVARDFAVDDGVEGRLLGQGPQAGGDEDLLAHDLAARLPFLERGGRRPGEVAVVVLGLVEPSIARRGRLVGGEIRQ